MKNLSIIFFSALILNIIWENIHSLLYNNYMGGEITEFILIRASLFDAIVITIISFPFLYITFFKKRAWFILVVGTIIAIINEWYGLSTGRWAYNELMPILPIIKIGLTPTIQLGLLGYLSYKMKDYIGMLNFSRT